MKANFSWQLLIATGLVMISTMSRADGVGMPSCVIQRAPGNTGIVVPGFPGQRLYIHGKHPRECVAGSSAADCALKSYVLTGDTITAGKNCDGWSYVSFSGKRGTTTGWVPARRIGLEDSTLNFDPAPAPEPYAASAELGSLPFSHSEAASAAPACLVVRDRLNAVGTNHADPLPSLILNAETKSDLPNGVATDVGGTAAVANIEVAGRSLKAVSYSVGGMQEYNGIVELWDSTFTKRIKIGTPDLGDGELQNVRQDVVAIDGTAYFVERSDTSGDVAIFGFDNGQSGHKICTLTNVVSENVERLEVAAEPAVCHAAMTGSVDDAGLKEITPYGLTLASISTSADKGDDIYSVSPVEINARGEVDLDNDGTPKAVGFAMYHYEPMNGNAAIHREWPIILNADGTPAAHTPLNMTALEHAGDDDSARLFRFHGSTYFEHRWRSESTVHSHEIWKFSKTAATITCKFTTDRSARYEAVDAQHEQ